MDLIEKVFSDDTERTSYVIVNMLTAFAPMAKNRGFDNLMRLRTLTELIAGFPKKIVQLRNIRKEIWDWIQYDMQWFQMDEITLRNWKNIVKNLMYDKEKQLVAEFLSMIFCLCY